MATSEHQPGAEITPVMTNAPACSTKSAYDVLWEMCVVEITSRLTDGRDDDEEVPFSEDEVSAYISKNHLKIKTIVGLLTEAYSECIDEVENDWIRGYLYNPKYGLVDEADYSLKIE